MEVDLEVGTGQVYRIFAHVGNFLSADGATVTMQLIEGNNVSLVFNFWTRQDAVAFFRNMALAAEVTTATEEDEEIPYAALMIEATTTCWEASESGAGDAAAADAEGG